MSTRGLALALAASQLWACGFQSDRGAAKRIERLKAEYAELHQRFEKAVVSEPLVASAFEGEGEVVLAIRSGLIEELAGKVAALYLDRVTIDLGDVKAHSAGTLKKKTFLGNVKIGEWAVSADLGKMLGHLRAAPPVVSLRPPNLIAIELPVEIEESFADATLHFTWDSSGIANAVCQDFEITQRVKGRVLAQRHALKGTLRLTNTGGRLIETPLFPDRRILVRMDLSRESWAAVETALRAEDTTFTCGLFTKASDGVAFLRSLATGGISIHLPDTIFRAVDLPAQLQESVQVNNRPIGLRLTAGSLRVETAMLWSTMSVQVLTR